MQSPVIGRSRPLVSEAATRRDVASDEDPLDLGEEEISEDEAGGAQREDIDLQSLLPVDLAAELKELYKEDGTESQEDGVNALARQKEEAKERRIVLQAQQDILKHLLELRILFQTSIFADAIKYTSSSPVDDEGLQDVDEVIDDALNRLKQFKSSLMEHSPQNMSETPVIPRTLAGSALKRHRLWENNFEVPTKLRKIWLDLEVEQRYSEAVYIYPKVEQVRSSVEMLARGYTAFQQPIDQQVSAFLSSKNFDALYESLWDEKDGIRSYSDREYYRFLLRKFVAAESAKTKDKSVALVLDRRRTPSTRSKIERRSSKGKRIKFEPIPELINFMHPRPVTLEESLMQKLTCSLNESLFMAY